MTRRGLLVGVAAVVGLVLVALVLVPLLSSDSSDPEPAEPPSATPGRGAAAWQVVDLTGRPAALATGDGQLLVVDDEAGVLQRVDLATRSVGASTPVGGALVGVASVGGGAAWVVDARGTAVRVGPPDQSSRPSVELGGTLVDVVLVGDAVYVGDLEQRVVYELDAATGARRRDLAVPDGVVRLVADAGTLWVTGENDTVTPVDLVTGQAGASVPVGNGPIGLALDAGTLWVANGDDGTVSRLDAFAKKRRGPDVDVGSGPIAVGVSGDAVWVLNQDAGTVSHLRAATGERVEPDIAVPTSITRARDLVVTPDGIWITGADHPQAAFLPTA